MQEVLDHVEGRAQLRTTQLNVSPVPDTFSAEKIKKIRAELGVTQGTFATVVGVSRKTVEAWETGRYTPDGAARRLLSIIEQDPKLPERHNILRRA
jgi:putative transcriptional regulator